MLTSLLVVAIGAIIVAKLCPETPIGAWLIRSIFVPLGSQVSSASLRKFALLGVLIVAVIALSPAMPLEFAFLAASDVTAYVELLVILGTAASVLRSRSIFKSLAQTLREFKAGLRTPWGFARLPRSTSRQSRPKRHRMPAPEEGGEGTDGWAFA